MAKSTSQKSAAKEPLATAAPLAEGAPAPVFSYQTADGIRHSTKDLAGRPYVVYFYPKDDTPGCTKQACSFRDRYADFNEAGMGGIARVWPQVKPENHAADVLAAASV